jgi:hypothetical protein
MSITVHPVHGHEIVCSRKGIWDDFIDIYVRSIDRDKEGKIVFHYASHMIFKESEPGMRSEPLFSINVTKAQALMDSLWECGLRPTQGKGSAGAMAATQKHLGDMRKIAFYQLGMKEPK